MKKSDPLPPASPLPTAADSTFFLICTPGLEDVLAREVLAHLPNCELKAERGGVSLMASMALGLELNRWLKTPSRILLRLSTFGCRDFPKLFKKVSGFPLEEILRDQVDVTVHASSHGSRVKMKKRIEETVREARIYRLRKRGRPHARFSGNAELFVRIDDDVCTLSLDTSGELLHKRGTRPFASEAPLRETLAAAILRLMIEIANEDGNLEASARSRPILIDPMMGSGTFLLEALGLNLPVVNRDFAYQTLWQAQTGGATSEVLANQRVEFSQLFGFDINEKAVLAARQNLALTQNALNLAKLGVSIPPISLVCQDFFAVESLPLVIEAGTDSGKRASEKWLVVNPPYGERLGVNSAKHEAVSEQALRSFYEKLFKKCEQLLQPSLACFLLPERCRVEKIKLPETWRIRSARQFENGGLPVVALIVAPIVGRRNYGNHDR